MSPALVLCDFMSAAKINNWESTEGANYPPGLCYIPEEDAFNFALYSRHATDVSLLIFKPSDLYHPVLRYQLDYRINKSNRIWHCRIKAGELPEGAFYGYKIDGPAPAGQYTWHAFDKSKLLLDPYARAVYFPPDFSRIAASVPGANDGQAPLAVLLKDSAFDWQGDQFLHHEADLIIYELHVKGFTYHPSSGVPIAERGCFAGVVTKIPYLLDLGVTAVELMPVHQFDINNSYWGYNTLNFFSPHNGYSCLKDPLKNPGELINEFKTMVRELHKAGIEVILDVVYNHTGEGDSKGPVYSFKGIDNSTYYLISEDTNKEPYLNFTGTGNTVHTRNSSVRRLILDSLHYWRSEMHVDGFRFDLASVFNRNADGSISFDEPAVLGMISSDPDLARARFIAEPWDASGAFYLGKKFPGVQWMQWNSAFRDDIRRFVKGENGFLTKTINRIYGSEDIFPDDLPNAFHAYQSVNYVNSHDGFTLYDLVSYNGKHNEANGENNLDGSPDNFSWNCGAEGDTDLSPEVLRLRKKQAKNFCTLLFISNGTPMLVAGDEFLRSQKGNDNPYNQDNEVSWVDWSLKLKNHDVYTFFKKMIAFRKAHPQISRSRFWRSDVEWFGVQKRNVDISPSSHAFAFYLKSELDHDAPEIYVMINSYWEPLNFTFHIPGSWNRIINTGFNFPDDFVEEGEDVVSSTIYLLGDRSIGVFVKRK